MNIFVFTLSGLCLGIVASFLMRIYFRFGVDTKNRLLAFLWIFYVFGIIIGSLTIQQYLEHLGILGELSKKQRIIFILLWLIPYGITSMLFTLRILKKRKGSPIDRSSEK